MRYDDDLERPLHHSVPDRRDRQDADFAAVFRYLLPPGWEWLVGAPGQFVAQLLEQSLHALRLDGLERDPVSSRGPPHRFVWRSHTLRVGSPSCRRGRIDPKNARTVQTSP